MTLNNQTGLNIHDLMPTQHYHNLGEAIRHEVYVIEKQMKECPQIELEVKHYFSHGVYARELYIPKGVMLTGQIHKYENLNILTKGVLSVSVESEIKRLCAPCVIVSPPGTKRIAYAHEDTIWITIHGTNEKIVEKIEQYFIAKTEQEYLEFCRLKSLGYDDASEQLLLDCGT